MHCHTVHLPLGALLSWCTMRVWHRSTLRSTAAAAATYLRVLSMIVLVYLFVAFELASVLHGDETK